MAVHYRAYKYLEEVNETGIGSDNHFGEFDLREVHKVCNSMFSDMCKVYGSDNPQKWTKILLLRLRWPSGCVRQFICWTIAVCR